jgi:type VI secretion system FHA domain protein
MPLTLEVIGEKAARMGGSARKTFTTGGTIGRLADNDWIFPDEYISGHHAKISFTNGAFLIEDTSTNGVFINSQQNRLTRNKPHPLRSGDTIFIDDYEVRVTLGPEPAAVESYAPARPSASVRPLIPDEPFFDGVPGEAGAPNAMDPLALLGLQSSPAIPSGPSAASLAKQSPLAEHYQPPTPAPPPQVLRPQVPSPQPAAPPPKAAPPGFIPDDYDPMGGEDDPFASPPSSAISQPVKAAPWPPPARPAVDPPTRAVPEIPSRAAATVLTGPPRIPTPGARPPAEPRAPQAPPSATRAAGREARIPDGADPFDMAAPSPAPPVSAARPNVAPRPAAGPSPSSSPGAAVQRATPAAASVDGGRDRRAAPDRPAPAGGSGDLDFAAMLAAAGIDAVRVTPELSQQFGMILRVVVAGLMDVLRARDKIKDEFRMRMTTFKQADNNPLKFSANVEDALHNLLVKRNAAYLGPVEAFEDAFLDVRNHQMAMLAGVRVAYEAMLAEFDPDRLQKDFDPQAKGANFLTGGAKAKYWELYRNRFHDMVKDADTSFRHLFGDDFAKAYEEQLSRLRAANRAERK